MICDICKKSLIKSGNTKLFYCSAQIEWIKSLNRHLKYNHSFVSVDKNLNIISKLITVPPYIFDIRYQEQKTKISKIISFNKKTLTNTPITLDDKHEEKEYLTIDIAIDDGHSFPWEDPDKIKEKLKIYNIFS